MPDYRWGVFLAEPSGDQKIHFGDHAGENVWSDVPGEMRGRLRRLIVTQADTEPASVEQQRMLGHTAPSLYDMRSLFQVNVEEGRHLWAMVYLLHRFFGSDGREEGEALLERRSGDPDSPRILEAFNEPDRQRGSTSSASRPSPIVTASTSCRPSLAESGFDPLARTTQFMLTEEAYHMQTGENGVGRIIHRAAELTKEGKVDPKSVGAMPLDLIRST